MANKIKGKKKFWKPPSFEDFNLTLPNKKIKLDDSFEEKLLEVSSGAIEPKAASDLAIHPKKVGEVKNWIKWSLNEKSPILLITGPAGCGKTTTLKVSAKEHGILVKEWINPVDKTEFKSEPIFQTESYDKFNFFENKQIDKFDEFIFRSSRYKSLFEDDDHMLILVEDIPNIFIWRPKLFHSFLEKYKLNGKSPIVFIVTDDQTLNLSNSLFPNHIRVRFNITNIKFNPVNHSSLIKNLKALSDAYSSEKVSSQFLENIIKNSGGDLRSSTNDLLLFLRTSTSLNQIVSKVKKTKSALGENSKPLSEKDSSFDFYHILGRILYPKLKSEKDNDVKNPHRIFLHDVQQIADCWTGSFLHILHENYLQTYTKLKNVVEAADCFSFCDVLDRSHELEEYLSLIGVISLMLNNTNPKKTGFNPLKKSYKLDLSSSDCDMELGEEVYGCQLRRRDFLLDVNPFLKLLNVKNEKGSSSGVLKSGGDSDEEMVEIEEFED